MIQRYWCYDTILIRKRWLAFSMIPCNLHCMFRHMHLFCQSFLPCKFGISFISAGVSFGCKSMNLDSDILNDALYMRTYRTIHVDFMVMRNSASQRHRHILLTIWALKIYQFAKKWIWMLRTRFYLQTQNKIENS